MIEEKIDYYGNFDEGDSLTLTGEFFGFLDEVELLLKENAYNLVKIDKLEKELKQKKDDIQFNQEWIDFYKNEIVGLREEIDKLKGD